MSIGASLLRTARLVVRRYREADRAAHMALRADPEIARFVHWPDHGSETFSRFALEPGRHALDGRGWLNHAVTLGDDGPLIGDLGLKVAGEAALLGLSIAARHRRQGFGRELVESASAFLARHGIATVSVEIDEPNAASRALFTTLGFTERARLADATGPYLVLRRATLTRPQSAG